MGALRRAALAAAFFAISTAGAMADDWVAVRLRGAVLQLVDGAWVKLSRGDVVPDSRVIRTLRTGNVEFQRGQEHVTLGADTQIQIYDEVRARPFTTVKQYFGSVTVEAEVEDVQHFAVQTHYLAAVVKGTIFTVTAGDDGASVDVKRGAVFVQDTSTKSNVTVTAGETASVDKDGGKPVVSTAPGTSLGDFFTRLKTESATNGDKPGKPDKDETPPGGKPGKDDKSNSGKSDENHPGKGKPDTDDKTDNGKSDDDSSGKGKSEDDDKNSGKSDDDSNSGKNDGDNSGKGRSDDGDDD